MPKVEEPAILFGKSKWIWANGDPRKSSNIILRRTFSFGQDKPPTRAICRAACDTHYYLFVNGKAAVWCGGLNRGSNQAYYDEFDISKYLVKGDNAIVVFCQYYVGGGRDSVAASRAGFIFECNDLDIYSDESFLAHENMAYKQPHKTNCCYAGASVRYDASFEGQQIQNVLDIAFNSSLFTKATVLDGYPDGENGVLYPRPLPLWRFSPQPVIGKYKKSTDQFDGDTYTIALPREMRVTPYMEVTGNGQEKITITTDRTDCCGTFGDEKSVYSAHSIEYITKPTLNVFEGFVPMTGETLIFSMPRTVRILKLGYRVIAYDTEPTIEFESSEPRLNTLFKKAMNTLYACMGSTLMDTPERERTLWLGDGSIAARALYYSHNDAAPLVKKVVNDVLASASDDVFYSCVPGELPVDIPSHGLIALGEYGLFSQYYNFTGDVELIKREYERLCDYLMLWEMTENGVAVRDGNRRWYDNLYNIDEVLIENALYYSACKNMIELGKVIGELDYQETFEDRMTNVAEYIEGRFDGLGYSSGDDGYDDRANALITLCGLVPEERKNDIARLLAATYNASPYMEWTVIEALGKLGRRDLAKARFDARYAVLAEKNGTTLGEDFNDYGTKCQSYQAAVISEIVGTFVGVKVEQGASKITITPDFGAIKDVKCSLKLLSGELDIRYKYSPTRSDIIIDNRTNAKVILEIVPESIGRATERRTITINKGKNKFTI